MVGLYLHNTHTIYCMERLFKGIGNKLMNYIEICYTKKWITFYLIIFQTHNNIMCHNAAIKMECYNQNYPDFIQKQPGIYFV